MRFIDLEAVVPGYKEARDRERLHRALAFAEVPWTLCGCTCNHLTPRHRVELQLACNAFAVGSAPLKGDVFQFLWRLNPHFKRKTLNVAGWLARRRVIREVKAVKLEYASRKICEYLAAMLQDMPEATGGRATINPPENYVHWMAPEAAFYMRHFHLTLDEYRDTPYLILQQFHRAWRLAHEDDPSFINSSDILVGQWQRQHTKPRDEN